MAYKKDLPSNLDSYSGIKHPAYNVLTNVENYVEIEANPVVCGIVGILDPPRDVVKKSIQMC